MVRTLTFSYIHKLKVLTPISAIKFGLAVSDVLFSSFKKGCVERDDSYVEGTRCSIFPLAAPNSKGAPRELAEKPQPLKCIMIFNLQKRMKSGRIRTMVFLHRPFSNWQRRGCWCWTSHNRRQLALHRQQYPQSSYFFIHCFESHCQVRLYILSLPSTSSPQASTSAWIAASFFSKK